MNTTRTLLALAAIAALGTTLISTSADARGFGGGFRGGSHGGARMAAPRANFGGMRAGGGFRPNFAFNRGGHRPGHGPWTGRPGHGPWNPSKGGHCGRFHGCGSQAGHWPRPGHGHWPRPYGPSYGGGYVAPAYVAPVAYQAPAPVYQAPAPAYQAPAYQAPAPAYEPPAPAAAPASPCSCLQKSYQQDGSVLFRDVCTNEAAAAMPQQQQAQGPGGYPQR